MKPTVRQDNICEIKKRIPITLSLNIEIPTVPNIKRGPELLVKAISLSLSSDDKYFLSFKSETILAPVGYPTDYTHYKRKTGYSWYIENRSHYWL